MAVESETGTELTEPRSATPTAGGGGVLKRLLGESAAYGLAGSASQVVAILLVPLYARVLGPTGVGDVAVINTTLSLSMMVVGLALVQAFFRWYLKEARDSNEKLHVLATTLGIRLLGSIVGALLLLVLVVPLVLVLYADLALLPVFLLIAPILFFDSLTQLPLAFLRAERRPASYVVISLTRAVLGTVMIVVLVVLVGAGVLGVVLGSLMAAVVATAVGMSVLRRQDLLHIGRDVGLARKMLGFSLPLVPAAIAGWTLNLSDRYILLGFTSSTIVGIYSLGYQGGLVINALAVQPFTLTWGAAYWEIARGSDAGHLFRRILTAFLVVASAGALFLSAFGTDAIRFLVGERFELSRYVVPFSAFAYVLYGVYAIAGAGLNIASQTRWVPLIMGIAAVASIGLNFLLIPTLSFVGAAISTVVAYAVLTILTTAFAQHYYPVPFDFRRGMAIFGLAIALAAAALLGPDSFLWRLAAFVVFIPILLVTRMVALSDLTAVLSALRSRGRKPAGSGGAS